MVKMELDMDGYQRTLFAYVISGLSHDLILGKPWMEREDVVYNAKDHFMDIREAIVNGQPLRVWEKGQQTKMDALQLRSNIRSLSAGVFLATVRKARKSTSATQLFSVTLAPSKKSPKNLERLPAQYEKY